MLSFIHLVCGLACFSVGAPMVGCAALVGAVLWQMLPSPDGE